MQLHKRLNNDQVKTIFKGYKERNFSVQEALNLLGVKRSRFFLLLKRYQESPANFSISYQRDTRKRISRVTEEKIKLVLVEDHQLVVDPQIPITNYNYSAIRDRLINQGIKVGLSTIIRRAKQYGYYQPRKKKKATHDREVITNAIGALIQHDASIHLWSPYAKEKWILITSLDDYSRKILYGDLALRETTLSHIEAAKQLMLSYGVPLRYYVDSLRVFRFVAHQKSIWVNQYLGTDEVNPQWKACVELAGSEVIFALSAEAKGKIERPYRWLQDRIVRTCAREKVKEIEVAREILRFEIDRYNNKQVHSTTKEIPSIRFEKAKREGKNLFHPLNIPRPYTHINDVFSLKEKRTTNGYRKISLWNQTIQLSKVPPYEEVTTHVVAKKGQ